MSEVITYTFNLTKLSPSAQQLTKAAVMYADKNRQVNSHTINIGEMCSMAGLSMAVRFDFLNIVKEACRAKVTVETIDTLSPDRDDLPFSCWALFEMVEITDDYFRFTIFNKTFEQSLIKCLEKFSIGAMRRSSE